MSTIPHCAQWRDSHLDDSAAGLVRLSCEVDCDRITRFVMVPAVDSICSMLWCIPMHGAYWCGILVQEPSLLEWWHWPAGDWYQHG